MRKKPGDRSIARKKSEDAWDRRIQFVALFDEGLSIADVARAMGVSYNVANRLILVQKRYEREGYYRGMTMWDRHEMEREVKK